MPLFATAVPNFSLVEIEFNAKIVSSEPQKIATGTSVRLLSTGYVEVATNSDVGGYLLPVMRGNIDDDGNYLLNQSEKVKILVPIFKAQKARVSTANVGTVAVGALVAIYQSNNTPYIKVPTAAANAIVTSLTTDGSEQLADILVLVAPLYSAPGGGGGGGSTGIELKQHSAVLAYPTSSVTLPSTPDIAKTFQVFVNGVLQEATTYNVSGAIVNIETDYYWSDDNTSFSLSVKVFYYES